MKKTQFSVSMCVYGKDDPQWFDRAVASVLDQTAPPDELVLVVDGPVPRELDQIIGKYETLDPVRVIRLEVNQGHGNARRIGLENCSYELVALMDADDISVPDRFEKQVAVFEADETVAIAGGQIMEFVEDVERPVGFRTVPLADKEIKEYLKKRCPFNQVTVMFRKSEVFRAGGYLDWYCDEDYYLWIRMHLAGMKFANLPDVLVNVRVGEDMYNRRGGWKYFCSEWKLQNFMLKNKVIGLPIYVMNVAKRLIVQVLLPQRLRGWVFRKFARNSTKNG